MTDLDGLETVIATLASGVVVPFVRRVLVEFAEVPYVPSTGTHEPLVRQIGDVRLDAYVTHANIAEKVDDCIDEAARQATSARRPQTTWGRVARRMGRGS